MRITLAKFCLVGKQHLARGFDYAFCVKTPAREVLAKNLRALMGKRADLKTQALLANKSKVAQTSISNMLRADSPAMKSPRLDQVEKVAGAFGLSVWQILLDPNSFGGELADMVMRPGVPDSDEKLVVWADKRHRERKTPV